LSTGESHTFLSDVGVDTVFEKLYVVAETGVVDGALEFLLVVGLEK
jgi:hypothetical protein